MSKDYISVPFGYTAAGNPISKITANSSSYSHPPSSSSSSHFDNSFKKSNDFSPSSPTLSIEEEIEEIDSKDKINNDKIKIRKKINYNLENEISIRVKDLEKWAKSRKIDPKLVRVVLKTFDSFITNNHYRIKYKNSRDYCPTRNAYLSTVQTDFAFYNRFDSSKSPGFVLFVEVLSHKLWAYNCTGKAAHNYISVYKKFFKDYERDMGIPVSTVSTDKEKALSSQQFRDYIRRRKKRVEFHYFEGSKIQAYLAESYIKNIRRTYGQLHSFDSKKYPSLSKSLQTIIKIINDRKIVVNNTELSYTPNEVNTSNVNEFVKDLHETDPMSYFSNFVIRDKKYIYSYPVGSYVRIKLKALKSDFKLGTKHSEQSLSSRIFKVVKNFLFVR